MTLKSLGSFLCDEGMLQQRKAPANQTRVGAKKTAVIIFKYVLNN